MRDAEDALARARRQAAPARARSALQAAREAARAAAGGARGALDAATGGGAASRAEKDAALAAIAVQTAGARRRSQARDDGPARRLARDLGDRGRLPQDTTHAFGRRRGGVLGGGAASSSTDEMASQLCT